MDNYFANKPRTVSGIIATSPRFSFGFFFYLYLFNVLFVLLQFYQVLDFIHYAYRQKQVVLLGNEFFSVVTRIRIISRHLYEYSVPFKLSIQGIECIISTKCDQLGPSFYLFIYLSNKSDQKIYSRTADVCNRIWLKEEAYIAFRHILQIPNVWLGSPRAQNSKFNDRTFKYR